MRSNWLSEIVKRAQSGPYMKEGDFDLKVTCRIKELSARRASRPMAKPVPHDDDMNRGGTRPAVVRRNGRIASPPSAALSTTR